MPVGDLVRNTVVSAAVTALMLLAASVGAAQNDAARAFRLDNTGPTVTAAVTPAPNSAGWNKGDVQIAWSATDAGSGVSRVPDVSIYTWDRIEWDPRAERGALIPPDIAIEIASPGQRCTIDRVQEVDRDRLHP